MQDQTFPSLSLCLSLDYIKYYEVNEYLKSIKGVFVS